MELPLSLCHLGHYQLHYQQSQLLSHLQFQTKIVFCDNRISLSLLFIFKCHAWAILTLCEVQGLPSVWTASLSFGCLSSSFFMLKTCIRCWHHCFLHWDSWCQLAVQKSFTPMVLPAYYVGQSRHCAKNQQGLAERPKLISCMCSQLNSFLGRTNVQSCGTSLCKDLCMGWLQMVEIPTSYWHACSVRCSESLTQTRPQCSLVTIGCFKNTV